MNVIFAAAEAAPFIKTGGLGDVIGSLPKALKENGVDARVIMPLHRDINLTYKEKMVFKKSFNVSLGWRNQSCSIKELEFEGVNFYFIDNDFYFCREGLYGYGDDAERYAFFSKAVLEALPLIDFQPDIIHCHDWHAGLISVLLKTCYSNIDFYKQVKTLFTIHNLQYQGIFPKHVLEDLIAIGDENYTVEGIEYYGNANCLKGGLVYSDIINTVSRSYAEEIKTSYFGEGVDGILRKREKELFGIINGIDYEAYNPENDLFIYESYNDLIGKSINKQSLQQELKLEVRGDVPIISLITRLVSSKGLDLVECVLAEIMEKDIQLIVLGTGEAHYEEFFRNKAEKYKGRMSANICFNNELAHKIYAGSDMFLMPSRYEPCGLGQIIALRYGTIPLVRETGGLKDTVKCFNPHTGEGNGFLFNNYNAHEMLFTIRKAVDIYNQGENWNRLFANARSCDYSWNQSAKEYIYLYNRLKSL